VIGVGEMGRNHARIYNELDGVELVSVCDADEARGRKIAKLYKVPYFQTFDEMLREVDLDVVSIAVPTAHHLDVARPVIERGISVLVEKPIELTVQKGKELVKVARRSGVSLMVGHIERFNPAVIKLREMIGELGDPTVAYATRAGPLPNRVKDVSAIVDLGVHDIDVLRHILDSDVERLYCECGRIIHKDQTDYGKLLLRFRNSALASIDVNWLTPVKLRRLVIQGLEAMFEVNYITQQLYKYEITYVKEFSDWSDILLAMTEGEMRRIPVRKEEPLKLELQAFIDAVSEESPPPITGEDGLRALEIALLAERSGRTHQVIEL